MKIREIFNTWYKPLKSFLNSQEFINIGIQVAKDREYYEILPKKEDNLLFKVFEITPYDSLKVVILGKEPDFNYDGLVFSDVNSLGAVPPLKDILREIELDFYDGFNLEIATNTDLSKWAEQGVLLLNTSLTAKNQLPNSHQQLWYPFIIAVLEAISLKNNIIWISFDNYTQKYKQFINNPSHIIIDYEVGNHTFMKCNTELKVKNLKIIKW